MNRLDFFSIETIDGVDEVDQLGGNLSNFTPSRQVGYYRIAHEDLMRPDLISQKVYGTVSFWWVICLTNNIENPLTDMVVGAQLQIPNILDVYDFNKAYRIQ